MRLFGVRATKTGNVLNYLPTPLQLKAQQGLQAIWMADTRAEAHRALDRFIETYDAKYPKATRRLAEDQDALLAFYDFPAEHWVHLRTTNPIEATFATICHRSGRARECVARDAMLTMVAKLGEGTRQNWRRGARLHDRSIWPLGAT